MAGFDYQGAINEGYTDEDILGYLSESNPNFDVQGAVKANYSPQEIAEFLSQDQPKEQHTEQQAELSPPEESSILGKAARTAGQFGLGVLEGFTFPVDIAMALTTSEGAQFARRRQMLSDELDDYLQNKWLGTTTPEDDARYESIKEELGNPELSHQHIQEAQDFTTRGLIEKATGLDLKPEGLLEKAATFTGFIKDPKKLFELGKTGLKSKDILKAISPTGKEALRGSGAGTALELAERGDYGPIGTMAAVVIGDIGGHLGANAGSKVVNILSNPRQALAEVAAFFSNKAKAELQKQILKDFEQAGVQADIGTLTDSNLIKWIQSRLAQSGLTGNQLDELRKTLTDQVKQEYKGIAESVGKERFANSIEAGEAIQGTVKKIRDAELNEARDIYKSAMSELAEDSVVAPRRTDKEIARIEGILKPGRVKSPEQQKVLDVLERIKTDIRDSADSMIYAKVKNLIGNKIALNDLIDYEVQGGAKQYLKGIVSALDRDIISYGQEKPSFAQKYIRGNKKFSDYARTFRNNNARKFVDKFDPSEAMKEFDNVKNIQEMRKILEKSPEGKELFQDLSRLKLDKTFSDNMIDSTTHQMKFSTFSKLLEKRKNREVMKEILPKDSYKRLTRLQRVSGQLAESAQKFLNASKSGVTLEDAGIVSKVIMDMAQLLNGNPWPLMKTGAGLSGMRYLTRLMGDPEFLKLVEEAISASNSNNVPLMNTIAKELVPKVKAAINATNENRR
jgi:hypothetical protein